MTLHAGCILAGALISLKKLCKELERVLLTSPYLQANQVRRSIAVCTSLQIKTSRYDLQWDPSFRDVITAQPDPCYCLCLPALRYRLSEGCQRGLRILIS